jgi:hypothetical protein
MVQRKNAVEKADIHPSAAAPRMPARSLSPRSIAREAIFLNDANTDCRLRSEIALPSLDLARES